MNDEPITMNTATKHVLFVDDEESIRKLAIKHFERFANEFRVTLAENGKAALDIANKESVDLVITDLHMPVMDGFELIGILNKKYPIVPVFVTSVDVTPELDAALGSLESLRFFKKPFDFKYLSECILTDLKASAEGKISGIAVPSLLQLMEMEQRTCLLTISSDDKTGEVVFSKGKLIDAKTDTRVAEAAAQEIISWENASVEIKSIFSLPERSITHPLMTILLEGMRLKDEKKSDRQPDASDTQSFHHQSWQGDETSDEEYDELKAQKASIPAELVSLIRSTPNIYACKIYNRDDFMLAKSSKQDSSLNISLSRYFRPVPDLEKALASGKFTYFLVNSENAERFLFFEFKKLRLILSLKPEFNITEFWQQVNEIRFQRRK